MAARFRMAMPLARRPETTAYPVPRRNRRFLPLAPLRLYDSTQSGTPWNLGAF